VGLRVRYPVPPLFSLFAFQALTTASLTVVLRTRRGSFYDIIDMHGVAQFTFFYCFHKTIRAINTEFKNEICFPWENPSALQRMSEEFYAANEQNLRGCVLAVDGIAIKIEKPNSQDTMNPNVFFNCKGFHALNVQAGCDARLRFRIVSVEHVGSTHDSLAWRCTRAAQNLKDGKTSRSVLLCQGRRVLVYG
jgi:hypothetical protein